MFLIFGQYSDLRSNELDVILFKFIDFICSNLIHLKDFYEIIVYMIEPDKEVTIS